MKKTEANLAELRKLTDDELKQFREWLGPQPGPVEGYTLYKAIEEIQKEQKIPKWGVYIVTGCGETRYVRPSQTVTGIYLNGEKVYSS